MRYMNGIVATLGVAFAMNAQAATVIEQHFEGLVDPNYGAPVFVANNPINAGYYGTGSEGEWYGVNSPATSNAQASSGSQSVVFTPLVDGNNNYTGSRQLIGKNSQYGLTSGDFEFSLRVYQDANGGANNANWYATVSNSANRANNAYDITLRALSDKLYVGFNQTPNKGAVTLPADQWFGVRVLGSIDTGKYSTYLDTGSGWVLIDEDRSFSVANTLYTGNPTVTDRDLDGVYIVSNAGYEGAKTVYLDDLYLGTPVPEPAALSLAGVAGMMLLRRRR